MYSDEIYTLGELFIISLMTGVIGYVLAAARYEKKIERERAIRERYRWQLNRQKEQGQ
jgi:hypothetical protein